MYSLYLYTMFLLLIDYECILRSRSSVFARVKATIHHLCNPAEHITWENAIGPVRSVHTGCPNKHGNSVTNSISSLLWISILIPSFISHNIVMSARVYFMKTVNGCKDVSRMSSQDEQWRRTSLLCLYIVIFLFY